MPPMSRSLRLSCPLSVWTSLRCGALCSILENESLINSFAFLILVRMFIKLPVLRYPGQWRSNKLLMLRIW
jgi:hypothetical protein